MGDALRLAGHLGARTVSLTGLLASATAYGQALASALAGQAVPRITTGHATTTAAVVLSIRKALAEAGRDLSGEHAAFLGLGSVGMATLRLTLACLPHPAELSLCDVYSKRDALGALAEEIRQELGYRGKVNLLESGTEVPAALYEASLIVGATNVPDIVDVDRLRPGTLLVDDSAPHCFRAERAIQRFRQHGDILFTEGGTLTAPSPLRQLVYVPPLVDQIFNLDLANLAAGSHPFHITGCVLSALLSSRFEHLPPQLGLVDLPSCVKHYEQLAGLNFGAGALHCEDYLLEEQAVADFRARHGRGPRAARPSGAGESLGGGPSEPPPIP
jgi:hypothetical protein